MARSWLRTPTPTLPGNYKYRAARDKPWQRIAIVFLFVTVSTLGSEQNAVPREQMQNAREYRLHMAKGCLGAPVHHAVQDGRTARLRASPVRATVLVQV
jgi:hypothetical protein